MPSMSRSPTGSRRSWILTATAPSSVHPLQPGGGRGVLSRMRARVLVLVALAGCCHRQAARPSLPRPAAAAPPAWPVPVRFLVRGDGGALVEAEAPPAAGD